MTDLPTSVQEKIVEDFKSNKEVFAQVYDFYFDPLLRFLLKRTMSAELAYDINSDAFLKAFQHFHRFKWQGISIKVWLFRIVINELNRHFRRPRLSFFGFFEDLTHTPTVDMQEELQLLNQSLFGDEKLQALHKGLQHLTPKHQNIISLYYFTGLSQQEIATVLHRSPGSVKVMMHRAVKQLRSYMNHS